MPPIFKAKAQPLHFIQEPVPGIYSTTSEGTHLVFVKPSGKDTDYLFYPRMAIDKLGVSSGKCTYEWSNSSFEAPSSRKISFDRSLFGSSSRDSFDSTATTTVPEYSSPTTTSVTFKEAWKPVDTPNVAKKAMPFHRRCISKLFSKKKQMSRIDLAGYKELCQPLKVEYNKINQRWMFSEEIALRTEVQTECHANHFRRSFLRDTKTVEIKNKFFLLDDGESWVKTTSGIGTFNKHGINKMTTNLYRFGGSAMSLQPNTEDGRKLLSTMAPNITQDTEDTTVAPRYIQLAQYMGYTDIVHVDGYPSLRLLTKPKQPLVDDFEEMREKGKPAASTATTEN